MSDACPFKYDENEIIGFDSTGYPNYGDEYIGCKLIESGYDFENKRWNECVGEVSCPIMKR